MTKYVQSKALVFDTQSVRSEEWNGHLRVEQSNLTKANICEYYGSEINHYDKYGLNPNEKYRFLRSPEALQKAVASFKERPLLNVHKAADADQLDNSKVIGTTGSNPVFEFPYIRNSLTIWDGDYIDAIKTGKQAELSASYAFTPVMEKGEFDGEPYDGIMTEIYVDHVALVPEGRAGPDVRVADAKSTFNTHYKIKGKEMPKLNPMGQVLFASLTGLLNNGRANDSNARDIVDVVSKATKTKRSMVPQVVSSLLIGYSMANDEEAKKIEETVNKAMDEADPDDKVGDEDPVETLDDDDEDKPAASDEENKDKPQTGDAEPEKDKKEAGASDSRAVPPQPSQVQPPAQAFDAASLERSIEKRLMEKAKQAQEARQLVKPLVGEWAVAEDSGEMILRSALKEVTGKSPPASMNYEGLSYVADLTVLQKTRTIRAADARPTPSDLQRFGATRLRSI